MEKKYIVIIAVVIIAIIALVAVFASGMLQNQEKTEVTPFKTKFMEGQFTGKVKLQNKSEDFMRSYEDKENKITYNISTVDNASALMEIYKLQGVVGPEERTFNDHDWNIYFTQAMPSDNSSNKTMNIIICESQDEKQGYMVYMIFGNSSKVEFNLNTFCDAYENFTEPLLKSLSLKKCKNIPKINEEFGLTEDQFDEQMRLIEEYKKGNTSALEG